MPKRKLADMSKPDDDNVIDDDAPPPSSPVYKRRTLSVIDSVSLNDVTCMLPGHLTPRRKKSQTMDEISPDQGYSATPDQGCSSWTPEIVGSLRPEWMTTKTDMVDAKLQIMSKEYCEIPTTPGDEVVKLPVHKESWCYNMSHKNRGRCVVFNHEEFEDIGFENRKGSSIDAKRIEKTFKNLGFDVEICDNFSYEDVKNKITELSEEDHTHNDCISIFVLTHGLANDLIFAKNAGYRSDLIWKPFTADKCKTLAGKPKLFFFQACRGDGVDDGIMARDAGPRTETDSAVASYKIPTHADFLIAHCTVQGFYAWRNVDEGTWYIQSLCDVLDEYHQEMDLMKMLTITARKISTEYISCNESSSKNEKTQVPSVTSMLIRELYFLPKQNIEDTLE